MPNPINSNKKPELKSIAITAIVFSLIALFSTIALAIPNSLTLQGKLTNTAGASQQGTFNFTFRIYDASTGGNELWSSANQSVTTDANGIYDVILNGINLSFAEQYYLGIAVSNDNESTPRINLTSSPYSFRANTSEALNPNASYFARNLSISGHATIGNGTSLLEISSQTFNLTTGGSASLASNITLGDQIRFRFGQIIDNLANGWLKITGSLNVTSGLIVGNGANISNGLNVISGNVGVGTTSPAERFVVIGNANISGTLNVSGRVSFPNLASCDTIDADASGVLSCGTDSAGGSSQWNSSSTNVYFNETASKLGLGTNIPSEVLTVIGNVNVSGYVNISGDLVVNKQFNVSASSGNVNVAGIIDAGNVRILGNNVQVEASAFKISNYSSEYSGSGYKLSNFTSNYDARTDRFGISNYSTEYSATGYALANFTSNLNSANSSIGLWNTTLLTDSLGRILIYPREMNASVVIGFANTSKNVSDILTIIGSASVFGSLNATFINATQIRVGNNIVQVEADAFKISNFTSSYDNRADRYGNSNFTSQYDARADRFGNANFSSQLSNSNASISLWNTSGSNIFPRELSGNVGIGTTSPHVTARLHVANGNIFLDNSTESTTGNIFFGGNTSRGEIGLRLFGGYVNNAIPAGFIDVKTNDSSDGLRIRVDTVEGGTERMRISGGGNITIDTNTLFVDALNNRTGIGTTLPNDALEVIGNVRISGSLNASSINATNLRVNNTLFVKGSSVGIGISSPSVRLHVRAADTNADGLIIQGDSSTGASNPAIRILNGTRELAVLAGITADGNWADFATVNDTVLRANSEDVIISARNDVGAIRFGTGAADTEKVTITNAGNVGIGTPTPLSALHINSSSVEGALRVTNGSGSAFTAFFVNATRGRVGIGTTNPGAPLTIQASAVADVFRVINSSGGNIIASITYDSTDNGQFKLFDDGTKRIQLIAGWDSFIEPPSGRGIMIGPDAAPNARLRINNTDTIDSFRVDDQADDSTPFVINASGSVGIGTTSPTAPLHVNTVAGNSQIKITNADTGSAAGDGFDLVAEATTKNAYVIQREAADLIFRTNNVENMRIQNGGNVGINTTVPANTLTLQGTLNVTPVAQGSTPAIFVTAAGNVGIGTSNPAQVFHVKDTGGGAFALFESSGTNSQIQLNSTASTGAKWSVGVSGGTGGAGPAGGIHFRDESGSANTRMVIDNSGNVGIGTTSPNVKLDIPGNVWLGSTSSATLPNANSNYFLIVGNSTASSNQGEIHVIGNTASGNIGHFAFSNYNLTTADKRLGIMLGATDGAANSGLLSFYTTNAGTLGEKVRIDKAGNVGINTTTPNNKLTVVVGTADGIYINASTKEPTLFFDSQSTLDNNTRIRLRNQGRNLWSIGSDVNTNGGHNFFIHDSINSVTRLFIDSSGSVGVGTTGPASTLHINSSSANGALRVTNGSGSNYTAFFVNATLGRVGIGTTALANVFEVVTHTTGDVLRITDYTSSSAGGGVAVRTARGTEASPSVVQSDDRIGALFFSAYDGAAFTGGVATIFGEVDGTPGTGDMPARLTFYTTPDGSNVRVERMRITSAGNVGINTTAPTSSLNIVSASGSGNPQLRVNQTGNTDWARIDLSAVNNLWTISVGAPGSSTPDKFNIYSKAFGDNVITLTNSSNVGIGTASPASRLEVSGNATVNGNLTTISNWIDTGLGAGALNLKGDKPTITFQSNSGNYGNFILHLGEAVSTGALSLYRANYGGGYTELIRFDNKTAGVFLQPTGSGSVGIGTTSPLNTLHVNGTGFLVTNGSGSNYTAFFVNATLGRVGIGTASPTYKLSLDVGTNDGFLITNNGRAAGYTVFNVTEDGADTVVSAALNNDFIFRTLANADNEGFIFRASDGTDLVHIKRTGNVGINTTAPANTLTVQGTLNVTSQPTRSGDLFVASNGDIGFGTSSPTKKLDIIGGDILLNSSSGDPALYIRKTDSGNTNKFFGIGFTAARLSVFQDDGGSFPWANERLIINDGGSVGINTTAPAQTLTVQGTLNVTGNSTGTGDLFVTSKGYVGIGTASPGVKLDIRDSVTGIARIVSSVASGTASGGFFLAFEDDGAAMSSGDRLGGYIIGGARDTSSTLTNSLSIIGYAAEDWTGTSTASNLAFETTPTGTTTRSERMRIASSGNVGIGNTIPNNTLDVSGNVNVSGRLSYGTLAANSPHFLETMGSPEPLCIKSSIGKYVGCIVDENFEFTCRIDDRCNRKFLDAKLSQEIEKLGKGAEKLDKEKTGVTSPNSANASNLITANVINEAGLETNLSNILEPSSSATTSITAAKPEDEDDKIKLKIEKLNRIKKEVKEKTRTVKEAINELKIEELKEVDINEIESEEDAAYTAKPSKEKSLQQAPQQDYITKVNGSVVIRLG